jgi:hypothetical protein
MGDGYVRHGSCALPFDSIQTGSSDVRHEDILGFPAPSKIFNLRDALKLICTISPTRRLLDAGKVPVVTYAMIMFFR